MKKWFNYFVYLSIIFLIIGLVKSNYLIIPVIFNYYFLISSVLFLFMGFLFDSFAWKKTLLNYGYRNVSTKNAITSSGLSIFGKYIPGKIWVVIGRSAYISKKYNYAEKDTAVISLQAQFISLWVGIVIGIFYLIFIGNKYHLLELSLLLLLFLSLLLFSNFFHNLFTKLFKKILKKTIEIPHIDFKNIIKIIPWFFINWFCWCIGFFFLIQSLSPEPQPVFTGFSFALAGTLGILAIVMPGGIGVREGILVLMLTLYGIDEKLAITISVVSRGWFLLGEFFIFSTALIFRNYSPH